MRVDRLSRMMSAQSLVVRRYIRHLPFHVMVDMIQNTTEWQAVTWQMEVEYRNGQGEVPSVDDNR